MNRILSALAGVLLAVTCQAQLTNGVKISQLGNATTLDGTEVVPLVQAGVTKIATVNQLITPATAAVNVTSNFFLLVTQTNSDNISTLNTSTAAGLAGLTSTENGNKIFLQAVAATNAAATLSVSNQAVLMAGTNAAAILSVSNQAVLMSGTNAAAITALQTSGIATNGGSVSFSNVNYGIYTMPPFTNSGTITVDLSKGSLQQIYAHNSGQSYLYPIYVVLTNASLGQNVALLIRNVDPGIGSPVFRMYYPSGVLNFSGSSGGYLNLGMSRDALLNFTVYDPSNIVFTAAAQP